jgi:hypothetical protein
MFHRSISIIDLKSLSYKLSNQIGVKEKLRVAQILNLRRCFKSQKEFGTLACRSINRVARTEVLKDRQLGQMSAFSLLPLLLL